MDRDAEISALSAQTLALGAVISKVFHQISKADPSLATAVRQGFDDAARLVEHFAIEVGKAASPEHTVKALHIVEQLRAASLSDHHKPRHGV